MINTYLFLWYKVFGKLYILAANVETAKIYMRKKGLTKKECCILDEIESLRGTIGKLIICTNGWKKSNLYRSNKFTFDHYRNIGRILVVEDYLTYDIHR